MDFDTLLQNAVDLNDSNEALALIESGNCDLNFVYEDGFTPLMNVICCLHNKKEREIIVSALIKSGNCNIGYIDRDGDTALMVSIKCRQTDTAIKLLDSGLIDLTHKNRDGNNALSLSIIYIDDVKVTMKLIQTGLFDLNDVFGGFRNTILMLACNNRNTKLAMKLIQTGQCNLHYKNLNRKSAIYIALRNQMWQIVYVLLTGDVANGERIGQNPKFIEFCKTKIVDYENIYEDYDEMSKYVNEHFVNVAVA